MYSFTCEYLGEACHEEYVWLLIRPKVEENNQPLFYRELQPKGSLGDSKEKMEDTVEALIAEHFAKAKG